MQTRGQTWAAKTDNIVSDAKDRMIRRLERMRQDTRAPKEFAIALLAKASAPIEEAMKPNRGTLGN